MQLSDPDTFNDRYVKVSTYRRGPVYFNKQVYKQRMYLTVLPYLQDANSRAQSKGKKAHCIVTGLGLGNWMLINDQKQLLVDVYQHVLEDTWLPNIGTLEFSWFGER